MSNYLCGNFLFKNKLSIDKQIELSYRIIEVVLAEHICVQLGYSIFQDTVFEIIGEKYKNLEGEHLPFFIIDSPISNVSHEIISSFNHEYNKDDLLFLKEKLEKIKKVMENILNFREISQIILFFSEGFDTEYKEINISLNEFVDSCIPLYIEENFFVPSLKYVFVK
jgi:hypothetical protein